MRIETTDPITGNDVKDLEHAPFVVEGSGPNALKIYFETEDSKMAYLAIDLEQPDEGLVNTYNKTTGTSMEM